MKMLLALFFTISLYSCSTKKYILIGEKYELGCDKGFVTYKYLYSDTLKKGDTITIMKKIRTK
jgi:hypothetical protein